MPYVSPASVFRAFIAVSVALTTGIAGCAARPPQVVSTIVQEGLNVVRIQTNPDKSPGTQPASLTSREVGSLLRGVRAWEDRNWLHRLVFGEAARTRAFRDDEIEFLAPALSKALAEAGPEERVYFHLSHPTEDGEEETTTGWLFIRDPLLYLFLNEVHDRHGPKPDISRYARQLPDIPPVSDPFNVTFEPERYVKKTVSHGGWFSAEQLEEVRILYRDAIPALPPYPIDETRTGP
jgi:hypothetical protein